MQHQSHQSTHPFRNARKECCGGSLAVSECQKRGLQWQLGFPKAPRGVSRVPSVRFGMPERSAAVAAWLPQSAARGFKGAIRPFRNARKECCGIPAWIPQSAAKGLKGAIRPFRNARKECCGIPAWLPQSAARHFKGAIRPLRNARKERCGGSLAISECQKRGLQWQLGFPKAARGASSLAMCHPSVSECQKGVLRGSLASPKRREAFQGCHPSVSECQKGVLQWQPGFPKAPRGVSRVLSVRFGMPERSAAVAAWLPQSAARGFKGAIRPFGMPERSAAVAAWLPQSAARGFKGAIRQFRNARKECCGSSLASPKRREAFQGCHPSVSECQKGVLRWQPGFPKAPRGISRVPSVRFGMPERSAAVAAWLPQSAARGFKGAIRPFRNARKECCGSLASPKRREAFQGCHPSVSECQKGVLR